MNGSHMIEGRRSVRRTLRNHTTVGGKRGLTIGVATDISGTGCGCSCSPPHVRARSLSHPAHPSGRQCLYDAEAGALETIPMRKAWPHPAGGGKKRMEA